MANGEVDLSNIHRLKHAYPVASQDNGKEITFSSNTPECAAYIAQCLQHYAGNRCFGRQPDRHGLKLSLHLVIFTLC